VLERAWWPLSRDVGTELPGLVRALTEHLGPVVSVGLDADAWDDVPAPWSSTAGRCTSIGTGSVTTRWSSRGATAITSACSSPPPHAGREAALAAVARAVEADGGDSARQILVATGIGPEPPGEES
jgi:hypothetical protein